MFLNPFPYAFGLDIGDLSIKLVQLRNVSWRRRGSAFTVVAARGTKLPHGLITNGELQEPETVRKYLQHLLEKKVAAQSLTKSHWVVAALPDQYGFLKVIDIEKEPQDIIEEDIRYAAKKHIPFDEAAYYVDWQIIPGGAGSASARVLIGAVPQSLANMYTYLLESVGLVVVAIELDALASARALITAEKTYEGEARALLDLGATRSLLTIYDHGHIQFNTSLSFSGELLTTAIAQKLHIPYDEAERLKITHGVEYKKSKAWYVTANLIDELVDQIQKAMNFYYSHFPDANKITHITMFGGGSAMKHLDKILSLKLKLGARPGNVWKNLQLTTPPPLDPHTSLGFATAIGLALRAADNPFFVDTHL